jgi:hypothetical protein
MIATGWQLAWWSEVAGKVGWSFLAWLSLHTKCPALIVGRAEMFAALFGGLLL